MNEISSRSNPAVKHVVELHDAKGRKKHKQFIAEGIRTCSALATSGMKLAEVYATKDALGDAYLISPRSACTLVSDHVMERMSAAKTPSGLLCVFHIPNAPSCDELKNGIVLAQIADPGNMGTLIRSAAAMNVKSVVIVEGADAWSPKVVQSSAGTLGNVSLFTLNWAELLAHKKAPLAALVVHSGAPIHETPHDALLVVGSEAHGIPAAWLDECDVEITLPMPGGTESLNAAVAGSIALYLTHVARVQ